jgi:hypothetical protein
VFRGQFRYTSFDKRNVFSFDIPWWLKVARLKFAHFCLFENLGNLKSGKNKPGRIIKFTQIWILEEELDSDEHVDLVVPLLETYEIN